MILDKYVSVVISCAGTGSRLGFSTNKSLVDINGSPLIAWQLDMLKNVEDIIVVVGFQADRVIEEVNKCRRDITFVYNKDYLTTKTGASFYLGARNAREYVIGYDGDLIVHPEDMKKLLCITGEYICYSDITSDDPILVNTDPSGSVISFSREFGDYEWTGPVCLKRDRIRCDTGHVYRQLEYNLPLKGIKIRACDIDTPADYIKAKGLMKQWGCLH